MRHFEREWNLNNEIASDFNLVLLVDFDIHFLWECFEEVIIKQIKCTFLGLKV